MRISDWNSDVCSSDLNILRTPGLSRPRSRCQPATPPTTSAVVRYEAMTVWTSRYGKLGLKMHGSHEPAGTNCPRALSPKATGECHQHFAAMIKVAEMSVTSATVQVGQKSSRLP